MGKSGQRIRVEVIRLALRLILVGGCKGIELLSLPVCWCVLGGIGIWSPLKGGMAVILW